MTLVSGLFTTAFRICESAFPRKCSPRPKAVVTINASVRRSIFSGPWGDIAFSENVGSLGTFWEKIGEHFEKHWEKLRKIGEKHRKNGEHVGNMLETCWKQGWELWNTSQSWYVWWLSTAHSDDIETAFFCCFSRIFNQSHRGTRCNKNWDSKLNHFWIWSPWPQSSSMELGWLRFSFAKTNFWSDVKAPCWHTQDTHVNYWTIPPNSYMGGIHGIPGRSSFRY